MNDKIINLSDHRKDPHLAGSARCLNCHAEWEAVAPVGTVLFECPECGSFKGVYQNPVLRNGDFWKCNCGCDVYCINKTGVYCISCGSYQEGF